jgi:hypothetical protein
MHICICMFLSTLHYGVYIRFWPTLQMCAMCICCHGFTPFVRMHLYVFVNPTLRYIYIYWYIGLAKTIYIHCIWLYIWWFPCQEYRIYTVYIWFWPTLYIYTVLANPANVCHVHLLPWLVSSALLGLQVKGPKRGWEGDMQYVLALLSFKHHCRTLGH